ncbi:MAG: hemin transporter [Phycisphaeraceae bacterium]|nr:hemin transporter [Phycisphaeraceae bacterium]
MSEDPLHRLYINLGQQGITDLVAAFYKQVPGDDILGPMYPSDEMDAAEARLRDFLIFRLGGPQTYIEQRGHPRLRMRHMPFAIDVNARNRWIALMTNALDEIEISAKDRELMLAFFEHLATFMINRQ